MTTVAGFPDVEVAVAVIMDEADQILWTWNEEWGTFTLPMTKIRAGKEMVEPARCAAVRAAAEALGVPVQVGSKPWTVIAAMRVSDRDYVVKHYTYHIFRAEAHPDYAAALCIRQPHIWLAAHVALSGVFEPLSHSAREILYNLAKQRLISGRKQETCVLILARDQNGKREFLLRWNPNWGFALPAKRKAPEEDALAVAGRVASKELDLDPNTDVTLKPAKTPKIQTFGTSYTTKKPGYGIPTDYDDWVFDAALNNPGKLQSAEPLAWVTKEEIQAGATATEHPVSASSRVPPGKISPTVFQILSTLDEIPWI